MLISLPAPALSPSFIDLQGSVIQLLIWCCETCRYWEVTVCRAQPSHKDRHKLICAFATAGRLKHALFFICVPGGAEEGVFQLRPFPELGGQPASQPPAL